MTARVGRLVMLAAMVAVQTAPAAPVPWSTPRQGAFVKALAAGPDGSVWVGTEGRGVWRYLPGAREPWRQFTTADGLGDDDAYALTIDRAGRVWVGHLDHGVSVYARADDGRWAWRNYDVLSGPLGERVYALAAAPGGDVWMATNRGPLKVPGRLACREDYFYCAMHKETPWEERAASFCPYHAALMARYKWLTDTVATTEG